MTMRFTFTANAAAAILAFTTLLIFGSVAGHSGPIAGSAQYNLQQQQGQELNNLAQKYQQLGSAPGADQEQLRWQYLNEAHNIKQKYLSQDTRGQMIDDMVKNSGGNIENTGSAPKDVRSDVDLNAKTPEAAQGAIDNWQANNHALEGPDGQPLSSIDWNNPPYKVVDRTTDTTLWLPCNTKACVDAKAADTDAWTTEGGLQGTGNSGRVRDPYGYYLDNEKKFAHGQDAVESLMNGGTSDMTMDDGLKTVAKSLDKAAERAGIKDNSELWSQVEALRNYGDPVEAGIADPGDPPEVVNQKLQQWLQTAESQMLEAKGVLKAAGEATAAARKAVEEALLNSNPADPENAYQNALGAGESANQRARVDASNATAEGVNSELGGVGNQPPPDTGTPELPNSGRGTYKPPSASSFQQSSLPEQLGATGPPGLNPGRAVQGAGVGAATGAAITYAACVATVVTTGNGSEKACRDAALQSIPESALWGAVAALSPWGEVIAAVYGGYQGAKQIGTALGEGWNTANALSNERAIEKTAQLLEPINNAILGCNFGAALLMARRLQQEAGFAAALPNLLALINRLQSEVDAARNVNALLGQANTTSDPAQRQQLLNQALDAAGNITCLRNRVASSSPPPTKVSTPPKPPPTTPIPPATSPGCTTYRCTYVDPGLGADPSTLNQFDVCIASGDWSRSSSCTKLSWTQAHWANNNAGGSVLPTPADPQHPDGSQTTTCQMATAGVTDYTSFVNYCNQLSGVMCDGHQHCSSGGLIPGKVTIIPPSTRHADVVSVAPLPPPVITATPHVDILAPATLPAPQPNVCHSAPAVAVLPPAVVTATPHVDIVEPAALPAPHIDVYAPQPCHQKPAAAVSEPEHERPVAKHHRRVAQWRARRGGSSGRESGAPAQSFDPAVAGAMINILGGMGGMMGGGHGGFHGGGGGGFRNPCHR